MLSSISTSQYQPIQLPKLHTDAQSIESFSFESRELQRLLTKIFEGTENEDMFLYCHVTTSYKEVEQLYETLSSEDKRKLQNLISNWATVHWMNMQPLHIRFCALQLLKSIASRLSHHEIRNFENGILLLSSIDYVERIQTITAEIIPIFRQKALEDFVELNFTATPPSTLSKIPKLITSRL